MSLLSRPPFEKTIGDNRGSNPPQGPTQNEEHISDDDSIEHRSITAFALLLSRKRKWLSPTSEAPRTPSQETTATALRKRPCETVECRNSTYEYTLYIAKNGGLDEDDHSLLEHFQTWISSPGSIKKDGNLWKLVLRHISYRVKSYLEFRDKPGFNMWPDNLEVGTDFSTFIHDLRVLLDQVRNPKYSVPPYRKVLE